MRIAAKALEDCTSVTDLAQVCLMRGSSEHCPNFNFLIQRVMNNMMEALRDGKLRDPGTPVLHLARIPVSIDRHEYGTNTEWYRSHGQESERNTSPLRRCHETPSPGMRWSWMGPHRQLLGIRVCAAGLQSSGHIWLQWSKHTLGRETTIRRVPPVMLVRGQDRGKAQGTDILAACRPPGVDRQHALLQADWGPPLYPVTMEVDLWRNSCAIKCRRWWSWTKVLSTCSIWRAPLGSWTKASFREVLQTHGSMHSLYPLAYEDYYYDWKRLLVNCVAKQEVRIAQDVWNLRFTGKDDHQKRIGLNQKSGFDWPFADDVNRRKAAEVILDYVVPEKAGCRFFPACLHEASGNLSHAWAVSERWRRTWRLAPLVRTRMLWTASEIDEVVDIDGDTDTENKGSLKPEAGWSHQECAREG